MPSPAGCRTLPRATPSCGGIFDFDAKERRLAEVVRLAEDPAVWSDQKRAQDLGRERKTLESLVTTMAKLDQDLRDTDELFTLARGENDFDTLATIGEEAQSLEKTVEEVEFRRMFANPLDPNNCFIDIQAGQGGTEAQDWTQILERMYLRYCERKGFRAELLEESPGDVAGLKSATLKVSGDYAFGHLRTETGIHRLVRKSPFDSNNRRHTSFASVFVYPEVDDSIEIEINPACQNDRSQHRNRAEAMSMLKARLFELEMRKRNEEKQALEDSKTDIGWGHQIRSYVLDQSRIKDLRTNVEIGNTQAVLDGNLDDVITASLKQGI